jgi:hypothetical protein
VLLLPDTADILHLFGHRDTRIGAGENINRHPPKLGAYRPNF